MTPSCPIDRVEFSSIAIRENGGEIETGTESVKLKRGKAQEPDIPEVLNI